MVLRQQIDRLLQTSMDRKEFLRIVGVGAAMASGFGWLIRLAQSNDHSKPVEVDYGATVYEGNPQQMPQLPRNGGTGVRS